MKVGTGCYLKKNDNGIWEFFVRGKSDFIAKLATVFGGINKDQVELRIEAKRLSKDKTLEQLGYYYGALIPSLLILYEDNGYSTLTDSRMDMMLRYYYMTETIFNEKGDMIEVPIAISESCVDEMSMLIDQVCNIEFREKFEIEPPDPEEFKKGKRIKSDAEA